MFGFLLGLLAILWATFLLLIAVRNERVFRFKMKLLDQVSEQSRREIAAGRFHQWMWRYEALEQPSYSEMVWKFWKSLPSFYDDWRFVQPFEEIEK